MTSTINYAQFANYEINLGRNIGDEVNAISSESVIEFLSLADAFNHNVKVQTIAGKTEETFYITFGGSNMDQPTMTRFATTMARHFNQAAVPMRKGGFIGVMGVAEENKTLDWCDSWSEFNAEYFQTI